jgi:hypothetical protein
MKYIIFSLLLLIGIGLLTWAGVGQYMAQIAYDGQYIKFRIINDVSLWGLTGLAVIALASIVLILWED